MLTAVVGLVTLSVVGTILSRALSNRLSDSALDNEAHDVRMNVVPRVTRHLSRDDLSNPMGGQRYAEFQGFLEESVLSDTILRVKLWSRDGTVLYSDDASEVGSTYPVEHDLAEALEGGTEADFKTEDSPELASDGRLLEIYAPVVLPGSDEVVGAFEIYKSPSRLASHISTMRTYIFIGLGGGLAAYYVIVFLALRLGLGTIRRQQKEIEARSRDTVHAVVAALDLRDREVGDHAMRVAELAVAVARQMGLAPEEIAELETGALLHDVGKIGVPDHVLSKPGPLTESEWAAMQSHPELGYQMLRKFPNLQTAALLVRTHHERFDGNGYPRGLRGTMIPLASRVFAVADAYDAITSNRPYRAARSHLEALAELRGGAGSQFDSQVVEAFLAIADGFARPLSPVRPTNETEQDTAEPVSTRAA